MGAVEGQAFPPPHTLILFFPHQLQPLDEAVLQQKPNTNAVATLEKAIEIQSAWAQQGQAQGVQPLPALGAGLVGVQGWGRPSSHTPWAPPRGDTLPIAPPQANTGAACRGLLLVWAAPCERPRQVRRRRPRL